ncbi:MAG TPA: hypothetical protein VFO29_03410 [Candidatus Rubrimentiphilum sp.]|nr:hypothetical protein [Candidatus Rubrimentiphilum sp.]
MRRVAWLLLLACLLRLQARATLVADPDTLYAAMKAAYDKGNTQGWTFYNQQAYLSTIFNAGRAYSLQRPNDPGYGYLAQTTVDIASALHYDPLINHEAVPWWVREAALYVQKNNLDPAEQTKAKGLLTRVDALDDPFALAQLADEDATALLQDYPRDANAQLERVEANWRSYLITHDASWRSLAFVHANEPKFPIANLPSTWGPAFHNALQNAAAGAQDYTQGDRVNAGAILARMRALKVPPIIASIKAQPHDIYMTTLAPADEYFGPMGMSILGIKNEMKRVNFYLGYGYNQQESESAVQIAESIDDLHKVYPRDRDLPQLLLEMYTTLSKIDTPAAKAAQTHMRAILTVEYQDTPQARTLLAE